MSSVRPGGRRLAWCAGALVLFAGLALGPAAHADRRAGPARLVITLSGVANASTTAAAGTFRASGAFADSGKFSVHRNPSTLHDLWRLSGKRATISVSAYVGQRTIVSGTGTYAHLHGNGTLTETSSAYGTFKENWTGTVTR